MARGGGEVGSDADTGDWKPGTGLLVEKVCVWVLERVRCWRRGAGAEASWCEIHSMMWFSRAVSSPLGPLGGRMPRQMGHMSSSRMRGRGGRCVVTEELEGTFVGKEGRGWKFEGPCG